MLNGGGFICQQTKVHQILRAAPNEERNEDSDEKDNCQKNREAVQGGIDTTARALYATVAPTTTEETTQICAFTLNQN